jgi:hypothetical protein
MPTRLKQPPATKAETHKPAPPPPPTPGNGKWKGKVIGVIFALIVLTAIWSTGVFKSLFAGPKIPLPRQVNDFALGINMNEVLQKYPLAKKKMRPFNNDPQFQIVSLGPSEGVTGPTSVDLLFYIPNSKLYFVSSMWDADGAKAIPVEDWAHQYRRWNKNASGSPEPLGADVLLKEWHFDDGSTEMTLRDLNYSAHLQRWEDLRDSTNEAAQDAFAKYRLDAGS